MVLHVFTSFLGGVPLCIPYGLYSGTLLGGTTWRTLRGYPGRVLSNSKWLLGLLLSPYPSTLDFPPIMCCHMSLLGPT